MMFHSSLTLSQTGVPLVVSAHQLWTRDIKNRRKIRNQKRNFTHVPVEELNLKTNFLVRAVH